MFLRPLRRLRKRTGFHLALWYSSVFILSSSLLFVLAYVLLSSTMREADREMTLAKMNEYALQYTTGGLQAVIHEIRQEDLSNADTGFLVRIATPDDHTLLLTLPHHWKKLSSRDRRELRLGTPGRWTVLRKKQDENFLEVASSYLPNGAILQVGQSSSKRDDLLERFRQIFMGIMIPAILIGFAGGSFLAFRAFRPIRDLIRTVRSIDTGNMKARVPSSQTDDELEELIKLFNGMLGKIELLITGMQEALDNVAHDLRTPVTRLRGVVETVLQAECEPRALREALMDCAEESERIVTMLNTLMDISEAETGVMNLHLGRVNIVSLVEEVTELYQYVSEDRGIGMSIELPDELYAHVDPNRIRQVIGNLLDNAIKYTAAGGRIGIAVCCRNGEVMITIRDNGVGIPSHELPRIFDRLYRGDKSRSHRGLGLGLSLVQAVVHAHYGHIEVASELGEGSQFTVFLPADEHVSALPDPERSTA